MESDQNVMEKKEHIYVAMIISFLAVLLYSFINLYLAPLITNTVGIEAYGFVSLAKSFVYYADIAMAALNSYAARYMSIAYLQGKKEKYLKYFNTVLFGNVFIAGIILFLGLVCIYKLEILLNIPTDSVGQIKVLFLLMFAAFYISAVTTAYAGTAYVKDCLVIYNAITFFSYFIEICVLVISFMFYSPQIWYVGLATIVTSSIVLAGSVCMTHRKAPELQVDIRQFSKSAMKELVLNGFWNAANSIGNVLNSGLDVLFSNLMLNAVAMGQVSIAKNISALTYTLYATVSQPFQPGFLKKYSEGDVFGLLKELKYAMKICGIITNTVFAGFCVLGLYFYKLWVPTQNISLLHILTVLAMLPCISEGCVYPLYYIYTLKIKNKIPCMVTIIGGICNVVAMFLLIKYTNLGVFAIVLTTAVVMNVINLVTNPLYMSHCLKVSKKTFYPNIALNILCCGVAVLTMKAVVFIYPVKDGWISFLSHIVVCGIAGTLLQVLVAFKPSDIKKILRNRN